MNHLLKTGPVFLVLALFVRVKAADVDVTRDIEKLEGMMNSMKLTPKIVEGILQQLDQNCPNKKVNITEENLRETEDCVDKHYNLAQMFNETKEAIPNGALDDVFKDKCQRWPKVKGCFKKYFDTIQDCWESGAKVEKFVDKSVEFVCGKDLDGAKIALFFAYGGLSCLEKHGDEVKRCVEQRTPALQEHSSNLENFQGLDDAAEHFDLKKPTKDEICPTMLHLRDCSDKYLRRCEDDTPHNIVTSLLKFVGEHIGCSLPAVQSYNKKERANSSVSSFTTASMGIATLMLSCAIAQLF